MDEHGIPHPPQFCESVAVSTHSVPQAVCPPEHMVPVLPAAPFPPPPDDPPEPMLEQAASRATIKNEPNLRPRVTVSMAGNCSDEREIATQSDAGAPSPSRCLISGGSGGN